MKTTIISVIVGCVIGFGLSNYFFPSEPEIQEKVVVKTNVKREKVYINKPDGTNIIIEREVLKTVQKLEREVKRPKKDWFVGVGINNGGNYIVDVNRRIIGNLYLGAYASTNVQDLTYGVKISYSF